MHVTPHYNKVANINSDKKWSHSYQHWYRHKLWLSESRIDIAFVNCLTESLMRIYIYIYIYIYPACHALLFSQSPGRRFPRSISRCMFSLQSRLGLPLFLLLFGTQSNILLGQRSSVILWTCPYHMSLFMLIVSIMSLFLCTLLLISSFRTCSNLDTPHALLQKSISKAFSRFSFLLFISHVSEPFVTILSTVVEPIKTICWTH